MKKFIGIVMSVAILLMSGCSSVQEPITTIPIGQTTTTVGDIAGTIEGDRYISHAGGVAFKLTGNYTADWRDTHKRSTLMGNYSGIDIAGPVFVWDNKSTLSIDYVLDEHLKEDATKEHTLEEWNKTSKYNIKSVEYIDDYKIGDKSCHALKTVMENNGKEASALQIYFFQDNGLLVLFTITGANFRDVDKVAKNIQVA